MDRCKIMQTLACQIYLINVSFPTVYIKPVAFTCDLGPTTEEVTPAGICMSPIENKSLQMPVTRMKLLDM